MPEDIRPGQAFQVKGGDRTTNGPPLCTSGLSRRIRTSTGHSPKRGQRYCLAHQMLTWGAVCVG